MGARLDVVHLVDVLPRRRRRLRQLVVERRVEALEPGPALRQRQTQQPPVHPRTLLVAQHTRRKGPAPARALLRAREASGRRLGLRQGRVVSDGQAALGRERLCCPKSVEISRNRLILAAPGVLLHAVAGRPLTGALGCRRVRRASAELTAASVARQGRVLLHAAPRLLCVRRVRCLRLGCRRRPTGVPQLPPQRSADRRRLGPSARTWSIMHGVFASRTRRLGP